MTSGPYDNQTFDKLNLSGQTILKQEYNSCSFTSCDFSKTNFTNCNFIDCELKDCNLSVTVLNNTGLKQVQFINCKLMGINFGHCNDFLFEVGFRGCQLDYSSFFKKKMSKTSFLQCSMKEVQFEEVDLAQAIFKDCNLLDASFTRTILEKADFRTASYYTIDPEVNRMKRAKFSQSGIAGLLSKYELDIEF